MNVYLAFLGHGALFSALHMYLLILITAGRDEETEVEISDFPRSHSLWLVEPRF